MPYAFQQAGDTKSRVRTQLQRVHPGGVDPAQNHIDLFELAKDAHPDSAVTDGQIAALEQREAKQRGHESLIKGGFGEGAWTQYDNPRVLHSARRRIYESEPHRLEERGQSVQVGLVVDLGHHPRHYPPVLHGVASTGGGLGPIRDHFPLPAAVSAQVCRDHEQSLAC